VIEGDRHVRVRWSDGFETAGEVIRSHKGRDVALIKTDPRDRSPLPVRTIAPQPGETVLAIGAPLDKQLQGTVTRGVMSANRVLFGYNFIQSDVMVSPGNSGGPLVDEKGLVIGLTDIGLRPEGVPAGLNFFIPIKEALEFLALDLSAPLAPAGPPARSAAAPRTGNRASAR
jgi:S1-C subfamily serine protease